MLIAIKSMRCSKEMTQKEVAEAIGVTQPTYCNIERGKRNPSISVLQKLATLFGCTVDDLLNDEKYA